MQHKLSRRQFLHLTTAALSTMPLLAACGRSRSGETVDTNEEPVAEATVVSIQTGWSADPESSNSFWPIAIEMFHEKPANADVRVELINMHGTLDELLAAVASGDAPDIYHTYAPGFNALGLAPKGVVTPLDDFVAQSQYIDLDDYLPQQWDDKRWNGNTWALPVTEGGPVSAFSWHVDQVTAAGLDAANGPGSWEEVVDWALRLTTYDANGSIDVVGYDPLDAMGFSLEMWSIYFDTPLLSDDKRTLLLDQEAWVQVLDMMRDIYQGIGVEQMAAHKEQWGYWSGEGSGFGEGKRAMLMTGYWQPGDFRKRDEVVAYNWVSCKNTGRKRAMIGSHSLWLTNTSPYPNEAFRFMEYILSEEINLMEFELRGGFMWSKSLVAKLDTTGYPGLDFFMQMPNSADDFYSFSEFATPISSELNTLWGQAVLAVINDEQESPQALADITVTLQATMDEAYQAIDG
ncbi:MAG: extracellular solute-binding protein [Chloroflexota bacterium]